MSDEPSAWGVVRVGGGWVAILANEVQAETSRSSFDAMENWVHEVVPLYRSPTLTDEEREAISRAIFRAIFRCTVSARARRLSGMDDLADEDRKDAEAFSGLLKRIGLERQRSAASNTGATMTNEVDEMSAASTGSQPMAWAVMQTDSYSVFASRMLAEKMQELCAGGEIVPLYSQPQPMLTDEEREACGLIVMHLDYAGRDPLAATLRGLLERFPAGFGNDEWV